MAAMIVWKRGWASPRLGPTYLLALVSAVYVGIHSAAFPSLSSSSGSGLRAARLAAMSSTTVSPVFFPRQLLPKQSQHGRRSSSFEPQASCSNPLPLQQRRICCTRSRDIDYDRGGDWRHRSERKSLDDLSKPQKRRLRTALVMGRRKVSVKDLANELQVDRKVLLQWFKEYTTDPASFTNLLIGPGEDPKDLAADSTDRKAGTDPDEPKKEVRKIPYYERKKLGLDKKRIPAAALRTMDMIYETTRWPDDAMIDSVCAVHKLRKSQVINWFKEKREQDGFRGRGY
eukprot:CAMPEP_0184493614 /NCGR_PEP_ID=MMETSP0113_2-20130426/26497_1 /TAXON_ID=91329 /ORGANISM="Norrisiella sphaerica, Strain BC52" /LENGTH=285 /DNA_ID=CAMNT_0026878939 /DNA_START=7 /DNA_END=864 /DNA_ORIENTATION=+